MNNLDYPHLLGLFSEHLVPKRTESACFLIWYLENYYRLDSLEAVDSVCDQRGDKGVDGIYVNDNDMTIDIFQSKISQSSNSTIGDTVLKEFYGTLSQFNDQNSINNLVENDGEIISNEIAGLYLMAFDLKEPWSTHRRYQVFDEKHADLFARPEVNADRILLLHIIFESVSTSTDKINNKLFGKYAITKYIILYMMRCIIENDSIGKELLKNPSAFVRDGQNREHFKFCISRIIDDIIIDINAEVDEYGDDFDYRGKLRDATWVKELTRKVVADYLKLVQRGRIESFATEWQKKGV